MSRLFKKFENNSKNVRILLKEINSIDDWKHANVKKHLTLSTNFFLLV